MAKFRKKPVVIEARQFTGTSESVDELLQWMKPGGGFAEHAKSTMLIETSEGIMTAQIGDWIIKGVKGEFYPCKPDIFAATYEPVCPHGFVYAAECPECLLNIGPASEKVE